jgi:transcription elongation factor GreA
MKKELTKEIRIVQNLTGDRVQLTREGKKDYETRLKHLVENERPVVAEELKEARAQGDLSENADYDAAKNKQAEIEAEIASIEDILSRVEILSERKTKAIRIGTHFEYLRDGKKAEVIIVGPVESDPNEDVPKIGSDTPFARAVVGLEEGQTVRVLAAKQYEVKITKIK